MDPEDDQPEESEVYELEDEETDVVDTEDGGAIVTLDEDDSDEPSAEFLQNLAETLPDTELKALASQILEFVERDRQARSKRDEQYEEGIRRTGLGDDAPGGAGFQGASRVVHPLLTEACVDFSSRAIKELFPANGPVKDFIPGKVTRDKIAKARRKTAYMNWQLTKQAPEFRSELEQLLTQVPLGGAQYLKVGWKEAKNRPNFLFVAIDEMLIPFAATNFYTAQRKTHVQYLTQLDYDQRVKSGMYRDVDLVPVGTDPDRTKADVANDKVEGREETAYNEDGLRTVFEVHTTVDIEDGQAPYIITIDKSTSCVLSIYRNWDEEDDTKEELQWFVEFPFVPWRGAYPIGITHMIGGLSAAATGALRALLDAAHISNSQTMLQLKGAGIGGQTIDIQPTQVAQIEGGIGADDIRKVAMPLPFNQPSAVLFQLLGFLVESGKGVVRTTMDDVSDGNANVPVGTTMAKIEQGMVVFSAIHMRLHNAMGRLLDILHRLNGMYLDDDAQEDELGEEIATRADFAGPMDVIPVSDPNIFSETQRIAQIQTIAQRAAVQPNLYNARKVEERILETLKVPNASDLLVPPVEPKEQNAVAENVAMTMGRPVIAFPQQDHIAHLEAHLGYMLNPVLGANRLIAPQFLPGVLNHIKEHMALWYAQQVYELSNQATGMDMGDAVRENKSVADKQSFDRMLAQASNTVSQRAAEAFGDMPPVIEQAVQMLQSMSPQAPQDPAVQAAMAETQRRAAADQAKAQLDAQRLQIQQQDDQVDAQMQQAKLEAEMQADQMQQQAEDQRSAMEMQARVAMNDADNQTAMLLAQMGGDEPAVNPNPNPQP
ncbi:MAG: hypothetical protein INH43_25420 [Acidobacteriaceae bacterium]|nr:hypothetical protein [Acidobacteriaceae bacterium]